MGSVAPQQTCLKTQACLLSSHLQDTKNKQAADKLICELDENHDGRISFDEYWNLIGGIASPISCLIRQQEESVKFTK